jgi:uncharacterized RDD family membrane protein YckC
MATQPRGVVTPEAVVLDFELAGIASRGVARLIDVLAQGALLFALATIVGLSLPGSAGVVGMIVGGAAVWFGYPIVCEVTMRGRSPGKAAFGLRVVTVEGAPIAGRHAFIRSIVGVVDFLVPPGGLFAVVSSLLSPRSQRLGDLVAGTMVLRERSAVTAPSAVWFRPPAGFEAYAAGLDVSVVSDAQFGLIRSFLLRVHELTAPARVGLAHRLALPIAGAMSHTAPPGVHPEQFLVCVAAAYQHRHAPAQVAVAPPPPPSAPIGFAPPAPPPPPPGSAHHPPPPPRPAGAVPPSPRAMPVPSTPAPPAAPLQRPRTAEPDSPDPDAPIPPS